MNKSESLTKKTLARLQNLAKGNNIAPDQIKLVESHEQTYTLHAIIRLTPDIDIKKTQGVGHPKAKGHTLLPSFDALTSEIEKEKKELAESDEWIEPALKDLEKTKGHGWGREGAVLFWEDQEKKLLAHEPCPVCRGAAQSMCPACQGVGTTICIHCEGRGQEPCPLCLGNGGNPANPQEKCPQCQDTLLQPCRFCNATGRIPCTQCKGTGQIPCPKCNGTGSFYIDVSLKKSATVSFTLGPTNTFPSGLLRLLQRIGETNLHNYADITLRRADPEKEEDPKTVFLEAKVPYADMKLLILGKGCIVHVFGEKGLLAGVPPFLDKALLDAREKLTLAAQKSGSLDAATKERLMQDALRLVLRGTQHPNELRQRYPVGLSPNTAQEIMSNLDKAVRNQTRTVRIALTTGFSILCEGLFATLFLTPPFSNLKQTLAPALYYGLVGIIPLLTTALYIAALLYTSRLMLDKKFPNHKVSTKQPLGNVGYAGIGILLLLYIVTLYVGMKG